MTNHLTQPDCSLLIKYTKIAHSLRLKLFPSTSEPPLLTLDEIAGLSAATIQACTRINDPKTIKALKVILQKLLATGQEIYNPPERKSLINKTAVTKAIQELESTIPNWNSLDLGEQIQAFNKKLDYPSIDQVRESLEILVDHLNKRARSIFGNLSPENVSLLINGSWSSDSPGVQARHDLSTEDVVSTPVMIRALAMLNALSGKGAKATTAGCLNRKFVASMMEQMELPDDYLAYIMQHRKVHNESDVRFVAVIRIVLELAGTIKIKRQNFQVTPAGRQLMEPDSEGGLFLMLFLTFFRELNIAYGDRMPDFPEFQDTLGYSLYQLSNLNSGWHEINATTYQLMLPAVAARIPMQPFDLRLKIIVHRFLMHLELFGLVELKREVKPGIPAIYRHALAFKTTSLLKRFIRFKLS